MSKHQPYSFELFTNNILKSYNLYSRALNQLSNKTNNSLVTDQSNEISDVFNNFFYKLYSNPDQLIELQFDLSNQYINIINNITSRFINNSSSSLFQNDQKDKRFSDELWQNNLYFDFLKQSYFMYSKWFNHAINTIESDDVKSQKKLNFYTQQFLNAISPSNFPCTNPTVVKEIINTNGENLVKGMEQLLEDLQNTNNFLNIQTTAKEIFSLGENLATTKGKIIFQNDIMQLIQYVPLKKQNFEVPILIIPPFINKYYILDLSEKNSFVKWLLEQGFAVFMISWINPNQDLSYKSFNDYMQEGPLAALDAIQAATNIRQVSAIGYCVGGTLLATTLAYMKKLNDTRIINSTLLTTLLDYSEVGDLSYLIDNIQSLEKIIQTRGYLDGSEMAAAFNIIKANDMIWSCYINNYLLGKEPLAFDILHWNSDNTRLPVSMFSYYIKNMYINNLLKQKEGIILNNIPIDLNLINIPIYMLSAKSDHIVPWKTTYYANKIFGEYIAFVLTSSGHVAGVINHPNNHKYSYFINEQLAETAEEWFENSQEIQGSWWNHWIQWLTQLSGNLTDSLSPENGKLPIIEDAPGTYVKMK